MTRTLLAAGLAALITLTAGSCGGGPALEAPEGFRASIDGETVEIHWDAVESADIYRLYRSGDEGETYRYIGDYSGLECRDAAGAAGRDVLYKICAGTERKGQYYFSSLFATTAVHLPAAPSFTGFAWQADGARTLHVSLPEQTDTCLVYRADSPDGDYRLIGTAEDSLIDRDAAADATYYYRLRGRRGGSESGEGVLSAYSEVYAWPGAASVDSVTRQDKYSVAVAWKAVDGAAGYAVYRSAAGGAAEKIGETTGTAFIDWNAGGGDWRYAVEAYGGTQECRCAARLSAPAEVGTNPRPVSSVFAVMYHNFLTEQNAAEGVEFEEYTIWLQEFEQDLRYLRDNGYTTITGRELAAYWAGEAALPEKAVLLTIDDGTWNVYQNAYPLLRQYGMKATLNVIGENIDKADAMASRAGLTAPYCNWDELREMSGSGVIEISSHSYYLHRYNAERRVGVTRSASETMEGFFAAVKDDFCKLAATMREKIGIEPISFAYPYSKRDDTSDAAVLAAGYYQVLFTGDWIVNTREETDANFYVDGLGGGPYSHLVKRVCRMTGRPLEAYIQEALETDYR